MSEQMEKVTESEEPECTKTSPEAEDVSETEKSGKTFTQEEVNGFIQSRLAQMKKQAIKEAGAELDARSKDLDAREMRLAVMEELVKREMPLALADIVSCSSPDEIGEKLDRLNEIYGNKQEKKEEAQKGFQVGGGGPGNEGERHDAIREAMGLYRK